MEEPWESDKHEEFTAELYRLLVDAAQDDVAAVMMATLAWLRETAFLNEAVGLTTCKALAKIHNEVKEFYRAMHESEVAIKH